MSRQVQLVLICEDNQHEAFVRRFLEGMGWDKRGMRVVKAPGGRGAGEQFVRLQFPAELRVQRSRPVNQAVVVMMDGDNHGAAARLDQLDQACLDAGIPKPTGHERVAVFIPTWNIETWLAYLGGSQVDERQSNYPRLDRQRDCQRHVDELVRMCQARRLREPSPPSLEAACAEYRARLEGGG
jgi:hypothetical protein